MLGIDYGRYPMSNGQLPNRDPETGTRYGIAEPGDLASWVFDELEYEYYHGCPSCGEELDDEFSSPDDCPHCGEEILDGEDYSEEPVATYYDDGQVVGELNSFGFWVYKSPVIAYGDHCSPCCPGAVSIYPNYEGNVDCYGLPDEFWRENEEE